MNRSNILIVSLVCSLQLACGGGGGSGSGTGGTGGGSTGGGGGSANTGFSVTSITVSPTTNHPLDSLDVVISFSEDVGSGVSTGTASPMDTILVGPVDATRTNALNNNNLAFVRHTVEGSRIRLTLDNRNGQNNLLPKTTYGIKVTSSVRSVSGAQVSQGSSSFKTFDTQNGPLVGDGYINLFFTHSHTGQAYSQWRGIDNFYLSMGTQSFNGWESATYNILNEEPMIPGLIDRAEVPLREYEDKTYTIQLSENDYGPFVSGREYFFTVRACGLSPTGASNPNGDHCSFRSNETSRVIP